MNRLPWDRARNVVYVDVDELKRRPTALTLGELNADVMEGGKEYLFDFSKGNLEASRAQFERFAGVSFPANYVLVGKHKGALIYTPLVSPQDPVEAPLPPREDPAATAPAARQPASDPGPVLPHVAFYVKVYHPIDNNKDCRFPGATHWPSVTAVQCEDAHISLIYRVNMMRSLPFGASGSQAPDAKLVRISIDEESSGAGIRLNGSLRYRATKNPDFKAPNAWSDNWVQSAIAQDYKFRISASNNLASILKTHPANNLNKDYENRELSGFEIGVSGAAGTDSSGPKAGVEPRYTYNQSRTLVFKTADYRVVRGPLSPQAIEFTWEQERYADPAALLSKKTGPIWDSGYPIDTRRISPIAYAGFVPNFDVVYGAPPYATGPTEFTIASSVNLWPVYTASYSHYYVMGMHKSFQAQQHWQKTNRVEVSNSFRVRWDHAVFLGGRPVNLQLGSFNSSCVDTDGNGMVKIGLCELDSVSQSFILDGMGRYRSVLHSSYCLDGEDLTRLRYCNANLSQKWRWQDGADVLINQYRHLALYHDPLTARLSLASAGSGSGYRFLTRFTDVFSPASAPEDQREPPKQPGPGWPGPVDPPSTGPVDAPVTAPVGPGPVGPLPIGLPR